jgi:hypothetical protein
MTFHTKDRQQAVGLLYCAHPTFTKVLKMPEMLGGQRIFLRRTFTPYRSCSGCRYFIAGNLLRKPPRLSHVERKITVVQRRRLSIFRTFRLL